MAAGRTWPTSRVMVVWVLLSLCAIGIAALVTAAARRATPSPERPAAHQERRDVGNAESAEGILAMQAAAVCHLEVLNRLKTHANASVRYFEERSAFDTETGEALIAGQVEAESGIGWGMVRSDYACKLRLEGGTWNTLAVAVQ
jgi:hypothetical protein